MTRFQVTFDAEDTRALGAFWAAVLGYVEQGVPHGYESWEAWAAAFGEPEEELFALVDPDGMGPRLLFQKVPEGKTAKNRVHLDVNLAGRGLSPDERRRVVDAEVSRLVGLGARRVEAFDRTDVGDAYWVVMQDPEGNEFCVH